MTVYAWRLPGWMSEVPRGVMSQGTRIAFRPVPPVVGVATRAPATCESGTNRLVSFWSRTGASPGAASGRAAPADLLIESVRPTVRELFAGTVTEAGKLALTPSDGVSSWFVRS